ncbi:MAG: chromosomal replication initiator protein DnaA, partial [Alistipes sp.]|nr:chromosomal replication initiator protein DnaA [Alistipes sp.]
LSRKSMPEFRNKYRHCDVLLIDDIQFIARKEGIQEEFFHTFNTLVENNRQVILASDRPPAEIHPLEERLKSRFEQGLLADIQPPDFELRAAIIKNKAASVSLELPDDVLEFLAENLRSNIRQIEGAIKKLGAMSFVSGKPVTVELARTAITDIIGGAEPVSVTVDKIFTAVCRKYSVTRSELESNSRKKELTQPRHLCIYLIREVTGLSLPQIGKYFSRDHSTILSSYKTIEKRCAENAAFKTEVRDLNTNLRCVSDLSIECVKVVYVLAAKSDCFFAATALPSSIWSISSPSRTPMRHSTDCANCMRRRWRTPRWRAW